MMMHWKTTEKRILPTITVCGVCTNGIMAAYCTDMPANWFDRILAAHGDCDINDIFQEPV